ncbi:MAG: hypothetical protein K6A30_02330 [Lachnospiraceae bacterium]|nr:hypothetical protein [Lachnospiraceae bacterium]
MNQLYEMIEERIEASGYPEKIDGRTFYNDISREAEEQDLGDYIFCLKKEEDLFYRGCMTILEDQFDLHYVDILKGDEKYHIDFDI